MKGRKTLEEVVLCEVSINDSETCRFANKGRNANSASVG